MLNQTGATRAALHAELEYLEDTPVGAEFMAIGLDKQ